MRNKWIPIAILASAQFVVTVEEVARVATEAGLPPDQVAAITADYGQAQLEGLRLAFGAVALFAVLGLWFTRHLPANAPVTVDTGDVAAAPAAV